MKTLFSIFCLAAVIMQLGCKKNPSAPKDVPKDPRQYTWTVDTLAYPGSLQTIMDDIWGSSPKDVYVVGHNDQNRGLMWHFDGNIWTDVKLSTTQGGTIAGPMDLSAIYGFAANDIWVVGKHIYTNPNRPPNFLDSSLVIHYDGVKWWDVKIARQRALTSIWGSSPVDIWAGGLNGTLYHYNGSFWKKESVPLNIPKDADPIYNFFSITGISSEEAYMLLFAPPPGIVVDQYYLFGRQSNAWVIVDSIFYSNRNTIWMSPSGKLYATGSGVHQREGSFWKQILGGLTSIAIFGIHDDNLFVAGISRDATGIFGVVFHYNGVDWHPFKNFQLYDVEYAAIWTEGKEVFIVGYTLNFPQKTIILHGK